MDSNNTGQAKDVLFKQSGLLPSYIKSKLLEPSDKKGKYKQTIDNARIIIDMDSRLHGKIRYNTLAYTPYVFGALPWDSKDTYREWNNADDSFLFSLCEKDYEMRNFDRVAHALKIVSVQNSFNPVTEFLESLTWDGKPHIENLLPEYLGVEKNEYSIATMRLFMLGAISRAYKPGIKFDYMPVITGPQGIGKSSFFKALACNDDWFSDNFTSIEGKEAFERLRGKWILEFGELLALKRSKDVESLKAFITSTADSYRPSYERRTEDRPRRCVFCGTTNSTSFLTDKTGNRRYLPLTARKEHIKKSLFDNPSATMDEFKQAWGEAMAIYRSGNFQLIMPTNLQSIVSDTQNEYLEEDTRVGIIQEYLDKLSNNEVCAIQIHREALGNQYGNPSHKEINEIHAIMQNSITGWVKLNKKKRFAAWGPQWGYARVKQSETVPETEQGFMILYKGAEYPFQ